MNQDSAQNAELRELILKGDMDAVYIGSISDNDKSVIYQITPKLEAAQNPYGSYAAIGMLTNHQTRLRYYVFYNFTSLGMVEGCAYVVVWDMSLSRIRQIAKIFWRTGFL